MWKRLVVTAMIVLGAATLAFGQNMQSAATDQWMACYNLGSSRGVHAELSEMPAWMDECLAGKIPDGPQPSKIIRSARSKSK